MHFIKVIYHEELIFSAAAFGFFFLYCVCHLPHRIQNIWGKEKIGARELLLVCCKLERKKNGARLTPHLPFKWQLYFYGFVGCARVCVFGFFPTKSNQTTKLIDKALLLLLSFGAFLFIVIYAKLAWHKLNVPSETTRRRRCCCFFHSAPNKANSNRIKIISFFSSKLKQNTPISAQTKKKLLSRKFTQSQLLEADSCQLSALKISSLSIVHRFRTEVNVFGLSAQSHFEWNQLKFSQFALCSCRWQKGPINNWNRIKTQRWIRYTTLCLLKLLEVFWFFFVGIWHWSNGNYQKRNSIQQKIERKMKWCSLQ